MKEPILSYPKIFNIKSKPHFFCPGCGHGIVLKQLGFVIDELNLSKSAIFLVDIGCSLLAWDFFDLPSTQTHHGRTTATAVGFKLAKPESLVIAYMGDGGGYAIGLQNLIHACIRNNPVSVILVNNTNYGMTGGQMAPTTMVSQVTDSTPAGKSLDLYGNPLMGPELLASVSSNKAYIKRSTVGKPLVLKEDLKNCLKNQIENRAFSFLEVLSYCPTNWKTNARETIDFLKKMEVQFPVKRFK